MTDYEEQDLKKSKKSDQKQLKVSQNNSDQSKISQSFEQKQLEQLNEQNQAQQQQVILKEERISKYLSRSGICSRRQAEDFIQKGMIQVNGKKIQQNVLVTEKDKIIVFTPKGEQTPIQEQTQLYAFYKPRGLICTHDDPQKRQTIFEYLQSESKNPSQFKHIISVGRLDFNSEGLILLTNNGDLANCLENPQSNIVREYRVRVQGKLDKEKLIKLNQAVTIKGVQYGPFEVRIDHRQMTNTWLIVSLLSGKNREIRRVMQKYDLRVSKLKRLSYGPYKIGNLQPGSIVPLDIKEEIKEKFYLHLRHKIKDFNEEKRNYLLEKYGTDVKYVRESEYNKLIQDQRQKVFAERLKYVEELEQQLKLENQNQNTLENFENQPQFQIQKGK